MNDDTIFNPVELATELTIAWLSNPNTRANADEVPSFLAKMHQAVSDLATPPASVAEEPAAEFTPAVTVKKSLASKDHIISMIDGKSYKTLKRHLSGHGLTPAQYRERYNLKADYPMVSEKYSEARRAMAHKIGLGQKGRAARAAASQAAAPARPGRKPKTA
jgi:predicted transcriptional regulator